MRWLSSDGTLSIQNRWGNFIYVYFLMQVSEDQRLLREKVQHLSGDAGIERMESALSETRSKCFKANESTSTSPVNVSPALSTVAGSTEIHIPVDSKQNSSRVVRSLFNESEPSLPRGSSLSAGGIYSDSQLGSSDEKLVTENELFVNEFLHERHQSFSDGFGIADNYQHSIEVSASLQFYYYNT